MSNRLRHQGSRRRRLKCFGLSMRVESLEARDLQVRIGGTALFVPVDLSRADKIVPIIGLIQIDRAYANLGRSMLPGESSGSILPLQNEWRTSDLVRCTGSIPQAKRDSDRHSQERESKGRSLWQEVAGLESSSNRV